MTGVIGKIPIQSTAGAIAIRNEKGQILSMEKVKVQRYVTGKRPDYAPQYSSDEDDELELPLGQKKVISLPSTRTEAEKEDRRLKRLQERYKDDDDVDEEDDDNENDRVSRHRRLHEPQFLGEGSSDEEEEERPLEAAADESSEEEELEEDEIENRRAALRARAKQRQQEDIMDYEEEKQEESGTEEESSEFEEYTDSEEEDIGPRLRPVFVRKKDRATMQEKEREAQKQKELQIELKKQAEERKRQTLRMVKDVIRKDIDDEKKAQLDALGGSNNPNDEEANLVCTDDENDEQEYEAWKIRELKRLKRDREEKEQRDREKAEIERIHNLTEEERRQEMKNNPREITNKVAKGKYRFLQKFYHRGAFFLDEEEQVLTRDFTSPTLEDHFDKTVVPKVMQVKNFGRSGRTKYTHLVDQDTTQYESPWQDSTQAVKFHSTRAGGMKQSFEKPTARRKAKNDN